MLLTREQYQKRKVVGGNLIGNVYNIPKKILSLGSKILTRPFIYSKNKVLKPVVNKATDLGTKAILNRVRQGVRDILTNTKVRKVLTDRSRAILSNIIAGSGLKRLS